MTEIITTSSRASEVAIPTAPSQTPVAGRVLPLVTEHEVMLATAAATLSPSRSHGFGAVVHSVANAVHFTIGRHPHPERHPAAIHYSYLENALMSREMGRL